MQSSVVVAAASVATVLTLTLVSSPASAQRSDTMVAGTLGVGWTDYLAPHTHINDWLASGAAVLTIDNPGFNIQANFDNSALRFTSSSSDLWSYGADIYWRDYAGSIGINVTAASGTSSGTGGVGGKSFAYNNYGWFGQWFALPELTMQIKGGRFQGSREGWYGDGGAVYYPYGDIALSLTADYGEAQHVRREVKDAALLAEYLPVHEIPVSVYLGYDYAEYSQLSGHHANVLLFGFKAYLGGGGREGRLVDYQRNGTTSWDGAPSTLIGLNF